MASIVVLVRHGKAQPRDGQTDDFTRTLTAPGRRALAATLPDALAPLGTMPEYLHGLTEVWSSSAYRAMETAEEVAFVLGVSEIKADQGLLTQDFDGFMASVKEAPCDVVVAVGHSPFMDDAAEKLCGVPIPFKTGALGIFDISEFAGLSEAGTLRAFSQGPRVERWKSLVKIESIIRQAARKIEKNRNAYLDDTNDAEALHDFRVAIRELRSEITFIEPFQRKSQNKAMQAALRELAAKTSRLRELDVMAQTVDESQFAHDELSALCAKMRQKECDRLNGAIGTRKAIKALDKLLARFDEIDWREDVERFGLAEQEVSSRFELMNVEFEADYLTTDYRSAKAAHKLRKNAKRLRYTAREFGDLIGEGAQSASRSMREVQDELGALCDARVNCEIIDSMPRKKLSDEADMAIAAIKQEQLDIIEAILFAPEDAGEQASMDASFDEPVALAVDDAEGQPALDAAEGEGADAVDEPPLEHFDEPEAFSS